MLSAGSTGSGGRRVVALFRTAITTAVLLAGCANSVAPPVQSETPDGIEEDAAERVIDGLCRLESHGSPNDEGARIFFGEVHDTLHAIAAAVGGSNRAAAARLLEAKAVIEGSLAGPVEDAPFAMAVIELRRRTEQALGLLGLPAQPCAA